MSRMKHGPTYPMGLPCPSCKTGQVRFRGISMTCMGFACPGGDHDHDDNRKTFYFDCCACAWHDSYDLVNVCPVPGCPWVSSWKPGRENALPQHRYIPPIMHSWRWSRTGQKVWDRDTLEPVPAPYVAPPPRIPGSDFFLENMLVIKCEERIEVKPRDPHKPVKLPAALAAVLGDGPGTPPYSIWGYDQFDNGHYPCLDAEYRDIPDWKTAVQRCEQRRQYSLRTQPGGMSDLAYIKDRHGATWGTRGNLPS